MRLLEAQTNKQPFARCKNLSIYLTLIALLSACAGEGADNAATTLGGSGSTPDSPVDTSGTSPVDTTIPSDNTGNNIRVVRNSPAIITGADTGSITEDVSPDTNNMLVTSGTLTVNDNDNGESLFIATTITNDYGSFSLSTDGNWRFEANNATTAIQSLGGSQVETVSISVNSLDRTVHFITINISGTDDAAIFSGTGSGAITEDDNPDANNQLKASGKLSISDADINESSFTQEEVTGNYGTLSITSDGSWNYSANNFLLDIQRLSAGETLTDTLTVRNAGDNTSDIIITINGTDDVTVISGDDASTITKDDDPDGDNLLEAGGILNIYDADGGQTGFIPDTITSAYGTFTLDAAGNWTYAADNSQTTVSRLANGLVLTDNLTVTSTNAVTHDVVITINSFDILLFWRAPNTREDTTPITLGEIAGYHIYYGTTSGDYISTADTTDTSTENIEKFIKGLPPATYYYVVTTYDTANRESIYSPEYSASNQ